jgi:hypothetical protein
VDRGEMPIELGDSWFSAKDISVSRLMSINGVKHLLDLWLATVLNLFKLIIRLYPPVGPPGPRSGGDIRQTVLG